MAHLTTAQMSGGGSPAIHAGLNVQICKFTMNVTASGSLTVALMALPAGAEVVDVMSQQSNTIGTGGELLSVYATIGGTNVANYIESAASSIVVRANGQGLGTRMTSSANLTFSMTNAVGTGTAACDFQVFVSYLRRLRGD